MSINSEVSWFYLRDAQDFFSRFEILWKTELHKSGRIKCFVDLYMAVECALKANVFHASKSSVQDTYKRIRDAGHDVRALGTMAGTVLSRCNIASLLDSLGRFSVFIRYSLDAQAIFFPVLLERSDAKIVYGDTIGNEEWIGKIKDQAECLIASCVPKPSRTEEPNLSELLRRSSELDALMKSAILKRVPRSKA